MSTSETTNRAFFVIRPREINDLFTPHPVEREQDFYVKKRIVLKPYEYENFITDLLVERDYINKSDISCTNRGDILECLLVTKPNTDEGVLVVPDDNGFIKLAASYKSYDSSFIPNYLYAMKSIIRKTRWTYSNRRLSA